MINFELIDVDKMNAQGIAFRNARNGDLYGGDLLFLYGDETAERTLPLGK